MVASKPCDENEAVSKSRLVVSRTEDLDSFVTSTKLVSVVTSLAVLF